MNVLNKINGITVLAASLLVVFYFATIYCIDYFEIDYTIIGVFRELLTIPFLLAQLFFLGISVVLFLRKGIIHKRCILLSIVILCCSSLFTGDYFFNFL